MDLHLRDAVVAGVPTVVASGEIDMASTPKLRSALLRAITAHPAQLVAVDLDGVHALDDTGLGVLLGAAARARVGAGDLALVCTRAELRRRLAVTGLDRAIEVVETIAALRTTRRAGEVQAPNAAS